MRVPKAPLPLVFEANRGQAEPHFHFIARQGSASLLLLDDGAILRLVSGEVRMRIVGTGLTQGSTRTIDALDPLPGTSSYFIGNDRANWRTAIPQFGRIRYRQVYPGVDLVFHGAARGGFEYDFVVAPGADPSVIAVGMEGLRSIRPDGHGGVILRTASDRILQPRPQVYQELPAGRRRVPARLVLASGKVIRFRLGRYDRTVPLVIDPIIQYVTYFGGQGGESGIRVAMDAATNVYIAGRTIDMAMRITNPALGPAALSRGIVFVSKFSPDLKTLIYSVEIGGSGQAFSVGGGSLINLGDTATGMVVDSAGNAYVTGYTASRDFPTANPIQGNLGGNASLVINAFILKLDTTASRLVFSTYLGGEINDRANAIALDKSGAIYIAGGTASSKFPVTPGAVNLAPAKTNQDQFEGRCSVLNCDHYAFAAKLSADGSSVLYTARFGGSSDDMANSLAVDALGNVYLGGATRSLDFPVSSGAYQRDNRHPLAGCGFNLFPCYDGFVAKLNATGTALAFATYFGGTTAEDSVTGIALDSAGNIYFAGIASTNLPVTVGAVRPKNSRGVENFVAALNNSGNALIASTYLGGFEPGLGGVGGARIAFLPSGAVGVAGGGYGEYAGVPPSQLLGFGSGVYLELDPLLQNVLYAYVEPATGGFTDVVPAPDGSVALAAESNETQRDANGFQQTPPRSTSGFITSGAFITRLAGIPNFPSQLKLAAATSTTSVSAGSDFTSMLTIANNGPGTATNLKVAVNFSGSPVQIASATASAGSCSSVPQFFCSIPALAAFGSATVTIHATAQAVGAVQEAVNLSSDNGTPQSAQLAVNVVPPPGSLRFALPVTKSVSAGAPVGIAISGQSLFVLTSTVEIYQSRSLAPQPAIAPPPGSSPVALLVAGGNLVLLDNAVGTITTYDAAGAPAQTLPANANATAMTTMNLDGNANPDLAVTGDDGVALFTSNGDGTFTPGAVFDIAGRGGRLTAIVAGSFTGAGLDDLVVSDAGGNIWLLPSDGMGGFGNPAQGRAGANPSAMAVGDFNGDGRLDVAVANSGSGTISLLIGDGAGNLGPPVNFAVGPNPQALASADFDGDGNLDLAVAIAGANTVALLRGNGAGAFQPSLQYTVGIQPIALAVGDIGAAGKLDIVTANRQSRDFSLLVNQN